MNVGGARVALVSEVLDNLLEEFGNNTSQRSVLFQAALQVCAEESRRVKQGQPPASLEVLVERARAVLVSPQGKAKLEAARTPKPLPTFDTSFDMPLAPAPEASEVSAQVSGRPEAAVPGPPEPSVAAPTFSAEPPPPPPPPVPEQEASVAGLFSEVEGGGEAGPYAQTRPSRMPLLLGLLGLVAVAALTFMGLQRFGPLLGLSDSPRPTQPSPLPRRAPVQQPRSSTGAHAVPTAAPTPVPTPPPTPVMAAARSMAATPVPTVVPTNAATVARTSPAQPRPAAPSDPGKPAPLPPAGWQTAETMTSPDWAGRAPAYVIHFSSYREREKAERDAAELGKRYSRPAYAAKVTLPGRGVWYRVILGDFATAIAAHSFRADLIAARTPNLGLVYWVVAP